MLQFLFSARGRLNRAAFWKGVLVVAAISILMAIVGKLYVMNTPHETTADGFKLEGAAALPIVLLSVATMLFNVVANVCLAIKRFHDRDKSGWMVLILFIPLVGGIWYAIETGFLSGTPGPNRFGPDPLGTSLSTGRSAIA